MIVAGNCIFGDIPFFPADIIRDGENNDGALIMIIRPLQKPLVYNKSIVIFYRTVILYLMFFEKINKKIHTYIVPQYLAFYNTALDKISKKLYPYYNKNTTSCYEVMKWQKRNQTK